MLNFALIFYFADKPSDDTLSCWTPYSQISIITVCVYVKYLDDFHFQMIVTFQPTQVYQIISFLQVHISRLHACYWPRPSHPRFNRPNISQKTNYETEHYAILLNLKLLFLYFIYIYTILKNLLTERY